LKHPKASHRELLTKSQKRRTRLDSSLSKTGKDSNVNQIDVDFDRYAQERNLQFENDLKDLCWRSKIPKNLTIKTIQNHQAKQERKSKIRHASGSTVDSDENIANDLAQIMLIEEADSDENAESCDSHDDTVSMDWQQLGDPELSHKLAMVAIKQARDEGQSRKEWALDDVRSTVPPTVLSTPPATDMEPFAQIHRGHARNINALLGMLR